MRWRESAHGQHVELGIAEGNLVGLLGELGATWSRDGQPLLPIGTIYDPFVNRAWSRGRSGSTRAGSASSSARRAGSRSLPKVAPISRSSRPSIGLEQPRCVAWEPAFLQDLEWALLHALGRLGKPGGESAYLRLSTRPIDQALADVPADPAVRAQRRATRSRADTVLRASTGPRRSRSSGSES